MKKYGEGKYEKRRVLIFAGIFLIINIFLVMILLQREKAAIQRALEAHAGTTRGEFQQIIDDYEQSFKLFAQMMSRELVHNPQPDGVREYLKSMDKTLLDIEGETYDGLYMYYQGQYLYSWDTPYSVYEDSGYVATERPWYKDAVAAKGELVFTPPYKSYANPYMLSTISQLQPDGETVFAYDIKLGDIQTLVSGLYQFPDEQVLIFNHGGTVVGSTREEYLGGNLYETKEDAEETEAFVSFKSNFLGELEKLKEKAGRAAIVTTGKGRSVGFLQQGEEYDFLILVPITAILMETVNVWLVPLLLMNLLMVYVLGRIGKEQKNRELREAYIELGQFQKRLEIALSTAQKAAAIDELTGIMNFRSFYKEMTGILGNMKEEDCGILILLDGDRFKQVNDNYGHNAGDEVIKLAAHMIVGRIRTEDVASRLHGDEFAIFIANTCDYTVAGRIMEDINKNIRQESEKRNLPAISLSSGAVIARKGDTYEALSKAADEALYRAKRTHNGRFASAEDKDF